MKRPSYKASLTILLVCMLSLVGCAGPDLIVLDSSGAPVEGAKIVGTSLSISGQTSYSDEKGCANIPSAVQQTKWISIYKKGYLPAENIDASQTKPIVIKLAKG